MAMCIKFRSAISDMVVRGAPAIAIAAALALAVEVESLKPASGTGLEAVTFLKNRLEYLVSRFVAPALTSFPKFLCNASHSYQT